jgi:hypothetical protein
MHTLHSIPCCAGGCCGHLQRVTLTSGSVTRRQFIHSVGALTLGGLALSSLDLEAAAPDAGPPRPPRIKKPLKVQPVLTYDTPKRREATSWRNWGGVQTDEDAAKEKTRITEELAKLKAKAEFPVEILPVILVKDLNQAKAAAAGDFDTVLIYAAGGGWGGVFEALMAHKERNTLMFLRHDPGPVYLWYEIVHPRFLRKTVDEFDAKLSMDVNDVVVDKYDELLWRLRALSGLKQTLGKRIVSIGGSSGWGAGGQKAPTISKELWKLDLVDYAYKDLEPRLKAAYQDTALVKRSEAAAGRYLRQSRTTLETNRPFVNNAFVLLEVLKDVMDEARTDAITINHCMGTIMGMSKTTACLPLSLLNDDGYLAFCESDYVVIPSGILLHYISGLPVFLNDPTYPHDGIVTLAHCTAPRKMDGKRHERARILTHFESDYGAAPKVEMKLGQITTNLVPDFNCKKWVGFAGTIVGNPFLDICRSQVDVKVHGDAQALLEQMKGFHWMLSYGDYLKECGYALKKLGVELLNVSAPARVA